MTQTYPRFADDTSGPFIRDLARGLVRGGDRVTVLTPQRPKVAERLGRRGVEVRELPLRAPRVSRCWATAAAWRRTSACARAPGWWRRSICSPRGVPWRASSPTGDFDLLHAHWIVPNGLAAAPVARRIPLVVGLHGSDVFLAEKAPMRRLVAAVLRRTRRLTGCSPELVHRVEALGFAAPAPA